MINEQEITDSIAYVQGIRNFKNFMHSHTHFIITTHINPDGDGLGAEIALNEFLIAKNKKSFILNSDPTPIRYHFLDFEGNIHHLDEGQPNPKLLRKAALVVVDANTIERTGRIAKEVFPLIKEVFFVDHHLGQPDHVDKYFNLVQATSTGEMVYYIIRNLGGNFSYKSAQALYTSILTDTGSFRFPKTDWKTHRIVADLLKEGVNPSAVFQEVYENSPVGRLKLLRSFLNTLSFEFNGKLSFAYITDEMLADAGVDNEETDGLVNMPLASGGIRVSVLFKAYRGKPKVALRSKGTIDVAQIASSFGGGGHFNAAGFRLDPDKEIDIQDVKKQILEKFQVVLMPK